MFCRARVLVYPGYRVFPYMWSLRCSIRFAVLGFPLVLPNAPAEINSRRSTYARIPLFLQDPRTPPFYPHTFNAHTGFRALCRRQNRRPAIKAVLCHDSVLRSCLFEEYTFEVVAGQKARSSICVLAREADRPSVNGATWRILLLIGLRMMDASHEIQAVHLGRL